MDKCHTALHFVDLTSPMGNRCYVNLRGMTLLLTVTALHVTVSCVLIC